MSVINSVLKDLEGRGNRFTPIDIQAVPGAAATAGERRRRPLLLLLLALVAGGAFLLYQQLGPLPVQPPPAGNTVATVVTPPTAAEPSSAEAVPEPAAVRNQILGLHFGEDENGLRMEFVLRDRAVAFLRERGEHHFSFHLRDVDSRVDAPLMRDNPWLTALDILPRDGGVDVNFETGAGVLVETRQQRREDEVVWAVSLRRVPPAPVVDSAPLSPDPDAADRAPGAASKPPAPAAETASVDAEPPAPPIETASAEAEPAADAGPAAPEPAEVRVDIRSRDPRARTAERLAYAVELMNSGRHADAEELLRGLFNGEAEISAREHLLALYASRGQRERYAGLARESMQRRPDHDLFATEYARSLVAAGEYREAVELLSAQTRLVPAQQAVLAAAFQRLDRHAEAARHYRLALEAEPGDARNWVGLGISLEHTTALAEALEAYRRAGRLGQLNDRLRAFVARRSETLVQVLN